MNGRKKGEQRRRRRARSRMKLFGTAARPRLSVFRSNRRITVQVIDDEAGRTLVSADGLALKIPHTLAGARKIGEHVAALCKKAHIEQIVFDRSGYLYHGKVREVAEGARQGGLRF